MRQIRIYQAGPLSVNETLLLSDEVAHHVIHVLRLKVNAELILFDGSGHEYLAMIVNIHKKNVEVLIQQQQIINRESPLHLHLGQAISRGERMDYTIQKATELGVTSITPLLTERCNVKLTPERWQKRQLHWQMIAINACQQCGRNVVPIIHPAIALQDWLALPQSSVKLLLDPIAKNDFASIPSTNEISLLIGNEGGLTSAEMDKAIQQGFIALQLGPRVLRTETAAVVAMSILQYQWGDL